MGWEPESTKSLSRDETTRHSIDPIIILGNFTFYSRFSINRSLVLKMTLYLIFI